MAWSQAGRRRGSDSARGRGRGGRATSGGGDRDLVPYYAHQADADDAQPLSYEDRRLLVRAPERNGRRATRGGGGGGGAGRRGGGRPMPAMLAQVRTLTLNTFNLCSSGLA